LCAARRYPDVQRLCRAGCIPVRRHGSAKELLSMAAQQAGASGANNWTAREVARIKPLVFLLALYPLIRWIWLGAHDGLSANPPEFLIRSSGIWALVLLGLTLCVTPLRRLLRQPALVRLRRMLGLFAFFYTGLHVLGWAYWERGWSWVSMWDDIVQRTFILVGMVAFVPMTALAVTSTRGWMHRL